MTIDEVKRAMAEQFKQAVFAREQAMEMARWMETASAQDKAEWTNFDSKMLALCGKHPNASASELVALIDSLFV